jgi:predicted membrane-bound spermidine synthase
MAEFIYFVVSVLILIATGIVYEYDKNKRSVTSLDGDEIAFLGLISAIVWPFLLVIAGFLAVVYLPSWAGRYILRKSMRN